MLLVVVAEIRNKQWREADAAASKPPRLDLPRRFVGVPLIEARPSVGGVGRTPRQRRY